jgi:arylsulfatase A-like enzyme
VFPGEHVPSDPADVVELIERNHFLVGRDLEHAVGRRPTTRRLYARMMEVFAGFLEHTDTTSGELSSRISAKSRTDFIPSVSSRR